MENDLRSVKITTYSAIVQFLLILGLLTGHVAAIALAVAFYTLNLVVHVVASGVMWNSIELNKKAGIDLKFSPHVSLTAMNTIIAGIAAWMLIMLGWKVIGGMILMMVFNGLAVVFFTAVVITANKNSKEQ